jgi:hypothetical protein
VPSNESFDLAGPAGRLEAILMHPDGEPVAAAVVCHAHPLHGGIMHFKAVFRAAKALQAHGIPALRFNFRGVGRSEGAHDEGRGEADDVRAALDDMERRFPGRPLLLGGFSFGSWVALRVGAEDGRVRAMFALGFPLRMVADTSFLDGVAKPRLFVHGENDEFAAGERIAALAQSLPPPATTVIVGGSDHFFSGHLEEMQRAIEDWLSARPWS